MKRIFTYEEAARLLPVVHELTTAAVAELEEVLQSDTGDPESEPGSDEYEAVVEKWAASITDLGIEVKGLWLIDFDCGSGYYCWKYPEPALQHFHGYEEGFEGRVKLN